MRFAEILRAITEAEEVNEWLSVEELSDAKPFDQMAGKEMKTPKTRSIDQLASNEMKTPKIKSIEQLAKERQPAGLKKSNSSEG